MDDQLVTPVLLVIRSSQSAIHVTADEANVLGLKGTPTGKLLIESVVIDLLREGISHGTGTLTLTTTRLTGPVLTVEIRGGVVSVVRGLEDIISVLFLLLGLLLLGLVLLTNGHHILLEKDRHNDDDNNDSHEGFPKSHYDSLASLAWY
jgi:hypothetical protein